MNPAIVEAIWAIVCGLVILGIVMADIRALDRRLGNGRQQDE